MEGRLLGGLASQDGVGPVLDEEGGGEGVSSQDGQVEEAVALGVLKEGERGGGGGGSYGIFSGGEKNVRSVNAIRVTLLMGGGGVCESFEIKVASEVTKY